MTLKLNTILNGKSLMIIQNSILVNGKIEMGMQRLASIAYFFPTVEHKLLNTTQQMAIRETLLKFCTKELLVLSLTSQITHLINPIIHKIHFQPLVICAIFLFMKGQN